jgi:serine/threonine protein kinase
VRGYHGRVQLGRYTIDRPLGAGGMSQVWLARAAGGPLVVLKRQLNPDDDERLRHEGRVGMRLHHAGIVQTLETFEHDGRPVLVLEYVPGASLGLVRRMGALPAEAVCRIGADVAEALGALHGAVDEAGQPAAVIHRDVSPANIIISPDGRARLIDLGIARSHDSGLERTRTGDLRGTVRYLAPELFEGKPHDAASDLWALGVCLFEAALGRAAAIGPEAVILARILRGTLFDLDPGESLPAAVSGVLAKLCAPERERLHDAVEAAWLLSQAERSVGDGRLAAAVAVYGTLESQSENESGVHRPSPGPRARPGADVGDDAFLRFAASTYCSSDDDALADDRFKTVAVTAVTPHPPTVGMPEPARSSLSDSPTRPERPAGESTDVEADSSLSDELPSTALWTPDTSMIPRMAPGTLPAGQDSWAIPPPATGAEAGAEPPDPPAGLLAPAPVTVTAPHPPSTGPALDELLGAARVSWVPIAAAAVVIVVAVFLLFGR